MIYRAGGYVRLSKEDLEKIKGELLDSISITNQKNIITDFINSNDDIELVDFYVDDGYSGGNFDRPEFKRLINDIECGVINCVITKDTSRLGREFIETGNYMFKYFPEHDVRYISILDNFDTFNPNGTEDVIPFKAVINDMYIKDISRKVKSVRHNLMKQGLFVGSSVPYGYKRSDEDNRKLVIDDYAAKVVKRIFNMKDKGITDEMIARTLTNDGILPPDVYKNRQLNKVTVSTNLWKGSTVKSILKNEVYIGTMIQGKYDRVSLKSKKKKLLPRNKWIIKEKNHEPIIDVALFEKINKRVKNNSKDGTRFKSYDYLLKGLVKCADCGSTMLVRRVKCNIKDKPNEKHAIYCCRTYATYRNNVCSMHYYREEKLNELVLKEIRSLLIKYSKEEELSKKYDSTLSNCNFLTEYQEELTNNQKKLENVDKAICGLYKDKSDGILTTDEFINLKTSLEKEKFDLEANISDLKIMLNSSKDNLVDDKTKKKIINDFLTLKHPNKQMLQDLINKITIDKDKNVRIYYNFNLEGIGV